MTCTLYGIKNCDTMKKARAWLDDQGVAYAFHDYKRRALTACILNGGATNTVGKRCSIVRARHSASWMSSRKQDLDQAKAVALMLSQPSMIKRPILDLGDRTIVGFKPERYRDVC